MELLAGNVIAFWMGSAGAMLFLIDALGGILLPVLAAVLLLLLFSRKYTGKIHCE